MSKVDAQRAMREAKYARERASGPTRAEEAAARRAEGEPSATAPRERPTVPTPATPAPADVATGPAAAGLCGHRSMNGRTCTREAGHAEKNHRYG